MKRAVITLPDIWIKRSCEFAQQVVHGYDTGEKSTALSCFGAEKNEPLQAQAKMAECAFVLFAGGDPERFVSWGKQPDSGYDVRWLRRRWDVKATLAGSRYLIWPIKKNHIFLSKGFDALVLVKHNVPDFFIAGWVWKSVFYAEKQIAPEGHALRPGTWFMEEDDLVGFGL